MAGVLWAHPFILLHYLRVFFPLRGSRQAILFAYADGTLMLRREFDAILKCMLEFCGLSSKVFKGHSFRIAAATSAALKVRVRPAN